MSFFSGIFNSLLGYCGSIYGPWLLGAVGGWSVIGRPLVAGGIIGAILGDVKTGILIGGLQYKHYILV